MSVFTSGNWLSTAKRRAKEGFFAIRYIFNTGINFIDITGILQAVGAHQATEDIEFDVKLRWILLCLIGN